jgi:indolepyruvate ferredoxin oxidoreductase beta subunit
MMNGCDILIAGVGGQGTLLTSRILGALALRLGFDVKVSEVHGMAQRGGSVITYVRMGRRVASPLIEEGGADFLVSFELMEALRYVHLVKRSGWVVVNTQRIAPMPVIMGAAGYPEDIPERLAASGVSVDAVDALDLARRTGGVRTVNMVMLGRLAG